MEGSSIPIAIAHGEGRIQASAEILSQLQANQQIAMQYLDNRGQITEQFPANPNGSPEGITGVTSLDGRATIMMPHPERRGERILGNDDGLKILTSMIKNFAEN